ncbi:hypothetical protein T4D_14340 [Trichinella pseudospiralis]|uniref:Uncharacterized protein n=1 Tax=Trichinella pseudospiralis TaxID=6337 RepID=A0A0V1FIB3_TRIPS|nr:hypothetical protein T4D_14340 [Trichinella pseudospiralis]
MYALWLAMMFAMEKDKNNNHQFSFDDDQFAVCLPACLSCCLFIARPFANSQQMVQYLLINVWIGNIEKCHILKRMLLSLLFSSEVFCMRGEMKKKICENCAIVMHFLPFAFGFKWKMEVGLLINKSSQVSQFRDEASSSCIVIRAS